MKWWCRLLVPAIPLLLAAAPPPRLGLDPAELRKRPISTARGQVGDLLRAWWREGTAAGNVGDWYDNRDRGHSDLFTAPYPQLQRIVYTPEDIRLRRDWALAVTTRRHVVFGNSSTSAPPTRGGSNVRTYYCSPVGIPFLYQHYTRNNLYIYPEHLDHDPGHNGRPGYGDLYPANTPYLITSQGSSGSDQPFLRALPVTLAAFRPEVKKKLVATGLLMPTVQMILRACNSHLRASKDYLSGKAHPTVFEGSWVNDLNMVRMAHAIRPGEVPPMVQLKVLEEDRPVNGRDFFEPAGRSEKLADTPCAIARIWRGKDYRRRLIVSAEGSYDLNKRPLTCSWVVLRGDPKRITITPLNRKRSRAELVVAYHERRPVAPGSKLESNRVDVGVFVHNGVYYSAPAFVTFFSLDCEARTYDKKGRVLEIGHGMGETVLTVADYGALCTVAGLGGFAGRLLQLTDRERAVLRKAAGQHRPLQAALNVARSRQQSAEKVRHRAADAVTAAEKALAEARKEHAAAPSDISAAGVSLAQAKADLARLERKQADAEVRADQARVKKVQAALERFLDEQRADLKGSLREVIDRALQEALHDPDLAATHAGALATLMKAAPAGRKAAALARQRLVGMGLAEKGDKLVLRPLRGGAKPLRDRLTAYEKMLLERYNAALLSELAFPGILTATFTVNFVDPRLTVAKSWRDVYRYDGAGRLLGWTRYEGKTATEFSAGGPVKSREKMVP
jgi:hypothetical protein